MPLFLHIQKSVFLMMWLIFFMPTRAGLCCLSPIRMRKKYTRVNILRCVFILRCANQPESKFELRSHGFYRQEYFCR